ncbi:hypothetical protein [Erwinia rhapontici]|uniref:hypothetical protein n=1 Tax=Erwinia rhapontici TaxID=55212 RepID=UPI003BA08940
MLYIDANGYIEAVRKKSKDLIYNPVTEQQNESFNWLISQLKESLGISTNRYMAVVFKWHGHLRF